MRNASNKIRSNDIIALLLLSIIIPGIWISEGIGKLELPGEIIGATIAGWTVILQYYFRKARAERNAEKPPLSS